jgi:CheY-like chemotaxis protein
MPRLLLVDDNPSIHRIAESLLAPTDVELVCVASAAEALDRLGRGDRFDVALVDTAMPGMDGWTLLDRLRGMEETARMPIALMAGVLDPVDPSKLAKAPIQGFLKKPIELRELGDRVKALLATPVVVSPSAVSTVPAIPASELLKHAQEALPEFRSDLADIPTGLLDVELNLPEPEDDLLVLTAEDLWPEELVATAPEQNIDVPLLPDVHLELEELDLDSLKELAVEPLSEPGPPAGFPPEFTDGKAVEHTPPGGDLLSALSAIEDLETVPTDFIEAPYTPVPEPVVGPADAFALEQEASLVVAAAAGQADAVPGQDLPAAPVLAERSATSQQAQVLLQALLAEPVLMDALVKALVARLGDQVLREIAWEVMPDLAGRLQR